MRRFAGMTPPRRRLALTGIGVAGALAAIALYDGERRRAASAAVGAAIEPAPVSVVVATARRAVLPQAIEAVGTIVADRHVLVASEVAGRITAIHFTSGDEVAAGAPLVQLNDGPLRRELDRRRASARLASVNLDRARQLGDLAISRQTLDERVATDAEARASVAQTEEDVAQRLVRAPFAGQLGVRRVNLGQYIDAGTSIATLTDPRVLHVDFTVPERHRSNLTLDSQITVTSDGVPGRSFSGRVTAVDPLVDDANRSVRVRATLAPDASGQLWPGKFARVRLVLPPGPPLVVVPSSAVEASLAGDAVYVVRAEGGRSRAHTVSVLVAGRDGAKVGLAGETVRPGEQVVVAGHVNLRDGAEVRARTAGVGSSSESGEATP